MVTNDSGGGVLWGLLFMMVVWWWVLITIDHGGVAVFTNHNFGA